MPRILACALLVLSAASALAQQQPQSPGQNPPPAAPPVTHPGDASQQPQQQQQQQQPPPTQSNPQDKAGVNSQIQSDLQSSLSSDPGLSGTEVQSSVDDVNITLTGSVQSQAQLDRVLALASPYARYRNVVNKVTVK